MTITPPFPHEVIADWMAGTSSVEALPADAGVQEARLARFTVRSGDLDMSEAAEARPHKNRKRTRNAMLPQTLGQRPGGKKDAFSST